MAALHSHWRTCTSRSGNLLLPLEAWLKRGWIQGRPCCNPQGVYHKHTPLTHAGCLHLLCQHAPSKQPPTSYQQNRRLQALAWPAPSMKQGQAHQTGEPQVTRHCTMVHWALGAMRTYQHRRHTSWVPGNCFIPGTISCWRAEALPSYPALVIPLHPHTPRHEQCHPACSCHASPNS
jgi:hypothetical protein